MQKDKEVLLEENKRLEELVVDEKKEVKRLLEEMQKLKIENKTLEFNLSNLE